MAPRQAFLMSRKFYLPEKNAVVQISTSLNPGDRVLGFTVPPVYEGAVHFQVNKQADYLEAVSPDQTKYIGLLGVDFNLSYIPYWAINYIMKIGSEGLLDMISSKSKVV